MDFHDHDEGSRLKQLDRYLPEKIRARIERYYARVNEQAVLDHAARNEEFLANPLRHVALFSDHGVVHVRDVACNILAVLEKINGVLIPRRSPRWLDFMKGYGVMLAYNHDIGMMDFSAFGRAMHPEFATQQVFSDSYDEIVEVVWSENCGNVAWRLINLVEEGALSEDPKLVLREMLAMALGHSKSKMPIEVLNDTEALRRVMLESAATDLQYLYCRQQVQKAERKLAQAGEDPSRVSKAAAALEAARSRREDHLGQGGGRTYADLRNYYRDFEAQGFTWLTSDHPALHQLTEDVKDTLRALRVADALRQRGTTLKTSGGYQVFIDQNTAKAVIALQKGSGEMLLLESDDPLSVGEANMASSEITRSGDLRVSFHRGSFLNEEAIRQGAKSAALVVDDIQRDTIDSFRRPAGGDGLKDCDDIQILIEETDDNLGFADLILEELQAAHPELGRRSRIVPSLKVISADERDRYLDAEEVDWNLDRRSKLLARVAQSGHKTAGIDVEKAFTDVRLAELKEGEVLIHTGSPPGFVYVPMGEGLVSMPLGGYHPQSVLPWIPLGNTRVIRGDIQEATVTAEQRLRILMIPKETYLKHWHTTYSVSELPPVLERLYAEEEAQAFELVLGILEQIAMIDGVLDDAEVEFIQKFTEPYGVAPTADEVRAKLLDGGRSDYVTLRQRTLDYLALEPPYLHVARLKDLVNLLAGADEEVSDEEALMLSELNNLLNGYMEDGAAVEYRVLIVPQSDEQERGIRALLPDAPEVRHEWGHATLCGSFFSKDYADMICQRYRDLSFYGVVEERGDEVDRGGK